MRLTLRHLVIIHYAPSLQPIVIYLDHMNRMNTHQYTGDDWMAGGQRAKGSYPLTMHASTIRIPSISTCAYIITNQR